MSAATIKDPRDVVLAPVVSEKSYGLIDEGGYVGAEFVAVRKIFGRVPACYVAFFARKSGSERGDQVERVGPLVGSQPGGCEPSKQNGPACDHVR